MKNQSSQKKKALFLYFELAGYVVACLERFAAKYAVEIYLVRYPVNSVAPFEFKFNEYIHVYDRKEFDASQLVQLVREINPDFAFVNGWSDKGYMAVCRDLKKEIPVVLTFDNPWLGTLKQYIATLVGPFYLHRLFTHCWVPGEPNAIYARKLGFKEQQLFKGMYSADVVLFQSYHQLHKQTKETKFPHRFIYMGRYTALKGFQELIEAFNSLDEEEVKDWELWCIGKGELEHLLPTSKHIKNFGFIQPKELARFIGETGVFVLPTHYEHWGVAVHEFAAAGFPLICSTTTSAATTFLHENENGYFTQPKSVQSIKDNLKKVIQQSDRSLLQMGNRSVELSNQISPDTWADTVWQILTKQKDVRN